MSLNITANSTTEWIEITQTAVLNNNVDWTQLFWFRWVGGFNSFGRLSSKITDGSNKQAIAFASVITILDVNQTYSTTDIDVRLTLSGLSDSAWNYFVVTCDLSGGVVCYTGSLTALATVDDSDATAGSGTATDGTANLIIGNQDTAELLGLGGDIAVYMYFDGVATLAEVQSLQFRPRVIALADGGVCQAYHQYGWNGGTGVNADYSGNGHTGTGETGVTVADHVPLGPPFGFDAEFPFPAAVVGGLSIPVAMSQYRRQHQNAAWL